MTEKQLGDVLLKADYVNGKLSLVFVYDKPTHIDLEFKINAQAKDLIEAIFRPLVESTATPFDDMALDAILKQL